MAGEHAKSAFRASVLAIAAIVSSTRKEIVQATLEKTHVKRCTVVGQQGQRQDGAGQSLSPWGRSAAGMTNGNKCCKCQLHAEIMLER